MAVNADTCSPDFDAIRDQLWESARKLTLDQTSYEKILTNLESKKSEPVPQTPYISLQEELNKIHATYLNYIEASIVNIKAQYGISQELKTLFGRRIEKIEDLVSLSQSLGDIQARLQPLLSEHVINEAEVKRLEDRIVLLCRNTQRIPIAQQA